MELNENQINIINHFDAIQQTIGEATAVYASHKTTLLDAIEHTLKQRFPDIKLDTNEKMNPLGPVSVRFYKDRWYKTGEYYFYAELYFEKAKIDKARYQKVIKEYPRKSAEKSIREFLQSGKVPIHSDLGQWHIWGEVSHFTSSHQWMMKEWSSAFVAESVDKLTELITETDKMVDAFLAFEQNGMKQ